MKPEDKEKISNPIMVDQTIAPEDLQKLQETEAEAVAEQYLKDHPEEGQMPSTEVVPF